MVLRKLKGDEQVQALQFLFDIGVQPPNNLRGHGKYTTVLEI